MQKILAASLVAFFLSGEMAAAHIEPTETERSTFGLIVGLSSLERQQSLSDASLIMHRLRVRIERAESVCLKASLHQRLFQILNEMTERIRLHQAIVGKYPQGSSSFLTEAENTMPSIAESAAIQQAARSC